jgi:ElaB/YqjD/DUF883 family membrane-anchored ribosome-binding protein
MANYREKLDNLRKNAQEKVEEKARELDEKYNLREKIGEGAKLATGAAKVGADSLRDGAEKLFTEAEKLREEAERMADDSELSEHARKVASDAARRAREVSENLSANLRETAEKAGETLGVSSEKAGDFYKGAREKAGSFYKTARKTAESAAGVFNFGVSWGKIANNTISGITKAAAWTIENPLKAAGAGASVIFGLRIGSAVPFLSTHWLPNSALPVWGLKKASDKFNEYLTRREELIQKGELTEAEADRVRFERDIVKFVGAPLLGAFSCAAGAAMFAQILNPRTITGAPLSWILGGNPILEGIWLFGNGVVCFKIGYDFFMIALDDQEEVQRIVREIKGLLPTTAESNAV